MQYRLLVPADHDAAVAAGVPKGAPILCQGGQSPKLGVIVGQPAGRFQGGQFADRCRQAVATGRRQRLDLDWRQVGVWDEYLGEVKLQLAPLLHDWCGRPLYRNDLEADDSLYNQREQARRQARQALMRGDQLRAFRLLARHNPRFPF